MLTLDNFWIVITARMLSSTRPQDTFQSPTGTCFRTIHFSELSFISFSLQTKLWGESHVFSPAKPNVYPSPPFSSYLCSRSIFLLDFRLIIGVHLTKPAAIPLHCAWRAPLPCRWCWVPCREAAACLLCLRSLRVIMLQVSNQSVRERQGVNKFNAVSSDQASYLDTAKMGKRPWGLWKRGRSETWEEQV